MVQIKFSFHQTSSGLIVPLLILVMIVLGYFLLLPEYRALRESQGVLKQNRSDLELKKTQLSSVEDLLEAVEEKSEDIRLLEEALPAAPRIPELIANIESLAVNSGLLLSNLQITLPSASASVEEAPVLDGALLNTINLGVIELDLSFTGKYLNMRAFMQNLEQNIRLIDPLTMNFGSVDDNGTQDFTLRVQTYFNRQPAQ